MAMCKVTKLGLRSTCLLSRLYHTGTIGEDNIIRGDKSLQLPTVDLFTFYKKRFEMFGDKVALVDAINGNQMTYNQIISNSRKLASFFEDKGFQQGDCVGIHTPNCIEYKTFLFGTLAKGMVFTTANPAYTAQEIHHQLKSANVKVLFTNSNLLETARKSIENTNTDLLVSVDETTINDSGVVHLSDILRNGDENFEKELTIDPVNDVAGLLYSSGTTGLPKGVMLTHHNFTSNILQFYEATDPTFPCANILCVLPMFHAAGLIGVSLLHFWHGATVYSLPSFDPHTFLSAIQNLKIERMVIVPPIALFMLNSPIIKDYDLSSLKTILVGAAPLDANVTTAFRETFPEIVLTQGYGMTECLITHVQPRDMTDHKPGSSGFVVKNAEWKIHCLKSGKSLGPNEKGEVCINGPSVMKGYLNNKEATDNCLTEDGWLHSGDLGYYDEKGNIFVVDRLKELIKYKALQVAPAELEDTLLSHPDIADSCVIGIPDERAGEVPRAYVVKVKDSSLTEDDVKSFISEHLSSYKQLRGGVEFVDILPKSASGKLLRRVLLQQYLDAQL